ncbi:MAG: ubiquitin-like small modifier protein 1 [Halobaculum sp.]
MQVECRLFGPFAEDTGTKTDRRETDAETVGELLAELEREYPALDGRLLDEEGADTAGSTVVTRNERHVRHLDGLETRLESGDVIRLTPSVYGGRR